MCHHIYSIFIPAGNLGQIPQESVTHVFQTESLRNP